MALSKAARVCQWMFLDSLPLFLIHPHQVCPSPHIVSVILLLSIFLFHCRVSLPLSSFLSLFLSIPLAFLLPDKLDEILAAAQQTISTNEAPGTRGQGPKRDRGRSFYGNEVCIVKHATVFYIYIYIYVSGGVCVCSCVYWLCHQIEKTIPVYHEIEL